MACVEVVSKREERITTVIEIHREARASELLKLSLDRFGYGSNSTSVSG